MCSFGPCSSSPPSVAVPHEASLNLRIERSDDVKHFVREGVAAEALLIQLRGRLSRQRRREQVEAAVLSGLATAPLLLLLLLMPSKVPTKRARWPAGICYGTAKTNAAVNGRRPG